MNQNKLEKMVLAGGALYTGVKGGEYRAVLVFGHETHLVRADQVDAARTKLRLEQSAASLPLRGLMDKATSCYKLSLKTRVMAALEKAGPAGISLDELEKRFRAPQHVLRPLMDMWAARFAAGRSATG